MLRTLLHRTFSPCLRVWRRLSDVSVGENAFTEEHLRALHLGCTPEIGGNGCGGSRERKDRPASDAEEAR